MCLVQVAGRQVHCAFSIFFEIVKQSPLAPHLQNNQLHKVVSTNWSLQGDLLLVVASAVAALVSSSSAQVGMVGPGVSGGGMSSPPSAKSILSNSTTGKISPGILESQSS